MRRIPALAAIISLIAGAFLAISGTTAHAEGGYDLWGLSGTDRVVKSGSCRTITVTASTSIPASYGPRADVEVWLRGDYIESLTLRSAGSGSLRGQFTHCPSLDGVGRFRLGPSEVTFSDDDFNDYAFEDNSKGYFDAKQASRFTKVKSSRKGSVVTIKSNPQFWGSVPPEAWFPSKREYTTKKSRNKAAFKLQRRNANGTGSWRTVKRAKAPKGKTLTFKVKAKKKAQYRVVSLETDRTFSSTSKVVRR